MAEAIPEVLNVRFWGTRGSLPTPGSGMLEFGGNTPCVSLTTAQGTLAILDCGSGMRELGRSLLASKKRPLEGYVFVSHFHWDHIQGFPFFAPAFIPGNRFLLLSSYELQERLEVVLAGQMEFEYFPITLDRMEADIRFEELPPGPRDMEDFQVRVLPLNHPQPCMGYRLDAHRRSVVYASDVEPAEAPSESGRFSLRTGKDRELVELARGADLLIMDAQLTMEEYRNSVGFGHSPLDFAVQVAVEARAKRLALFHHDPTHDDAFVRRMVEEAKGQALELGATELQVFGAAEGLEVSL